MDRFTRRSDCSLGSKAPRSYARAHPSYLHQGREHLYGMLRQERGHHRPLYLVSYAHAIRRCHSPLSGGRVESLRRGASGMDAARGVKGHGWPLYAGPRSDDGTREVERSETRMAGAKRFWLLFPRLEKVTRPAGRNQAPKQLANSPKKQHSTAQLAPSKRRINLSAPKKKTHTPFDGVRQSVPLTRYYLVCMIKSRRISVLIFTR